jgi:hypothetical protein
MISLSRMEEGMNKAILALGLIVGALGATSAVAQDRYGYGNGYRDGGYQQFDRDYRGYDHDSRGYERGGLNVCVGGRGDRLDQRINNQARRGELDWRTARQLHAMVDRATDLQRRYCGYGMNSDRAREIDRRFDQVERRLRQEAYDDWR